ncbi:hypothetical protein BD779DRAFT_1480551 [Infundibulicybe gibba]|nr:hypothetical protein BD779DRAFT_1480551 [Infundibulicybe gibba]
MQHKASQACWWSWFRSNAPEEHNLGPNGTPSFKGRVKFAILENRSRRGHRRRHWPRPQSQRPMSGHLLTVLRPTRKLEQRGQPWLVKTFRQSLENALQVVHFVEERDGVSSTGKVNLFVRITMNPVQSCWRGGRPPPRKTACQLWLNTTQPGGRMAWIGTRFSSSSFFVEATFAASNEKLSAADSTTIVGL